MYQSNCLFDLGRIRLKFCCFQLVVRRFLRSGSKHWSGGGAMRTLTSSNPSAPTPIPHLQQMPAAKRRRQLVVGTDCSGLEPLPEVLDALGLRSYRLAFSCDIDPRCRRVIQKRHGRGRGRHAKLFADIQKRRLADVPDHHLYVAGFPCQSFSTMGSGRGLADLKQQRGRIIYNVIATIAKKQPRAFILENVKGLVSNHKPTFERIMQELRRVGNGMYAVSWRILNTEHHGVPQHRERVYIVGIKKTTLSKRNPFRWPAPMPQKRLACFLAPAPAAAARRRAATKFKADATPRMKRALSLLFARAKAAGVDPLDPKSPVVMDVDASVGRMIWMKDRSPCITRSRGADGFYLPAWGRRMTLSEMLRLQGLPVSIAKCAADGITTRRQLGAMVGNAMSGNVLRRILYRLLPGCGLALRDELRADAA